MSDEEFNELAAEIEKLGYDAETAAYYAARIGDRPILDENGLVVVQRGREVLARLKLKFFQD